METLYDRLGVPRDVDPEDLRRAWKRIVRTVHPDAGGDTAAFQELEKAYDVLSHANTRAFYDLALDTYRPGASQQPMPTKAAVPPPEWISDLAGTTVLPSPHRTRWHLGRKSEKPEPPPAPVAVEEHAEPVPDEPTGRHEWSPQDSGRRDDGSGKRSGSTWKRFRAVSVETTRS